MRINPWVIPGFPHDRYPTTNITPLTYRDGISYLEKLEYLSKFVLTDLLPWFEENFDLFTDEFKGLIDDLVIQVNTALTTQANDVNMALDELEGKLNDALEDIINSSIELSGPVVAGILSDPTSDSAKAVRALSAPLTIWVDDYKQSGDVSDSEAWQRAINIATARDGEPSRVTGRSEQYYFHVPVTFDGLQNCDISGSLNSKAIISPVGGIVDRIFSIATIPDAVTPPTENVYAIGDSLTQDEPWLVTLAEDGNVITHDLGVNGDSATEAAFRAGALEVRVTFDGNAITTTGVGAISAISPADDWRPITVQKRVKASVTDVNGIAHEGYFYFRTGAGLERFELDVAPTTDLTFAPLTVVTVLSDPENKSGVDIPTDAVVVWFAGRNSIVGSTVVDAVAAVRRADEAMRARFPNSLAIGVMRATNEPIGSNNYATVSNINAGKLDVFGSDYYDPNPWLVRTAIFEDESVTPTQDDLAHMANDTPPPSIMNPGDTIHILPITSLHFGHRVYRALMGAGKITGSAGRLTNGVTFRNFIFDGGMEEYTVDQFDRYQDRNWPGARFHSGIRVNGHLAPGEPHNAIVKNISVTDCDFNGLYSLPILFNGCENVNISRNHFLRCLDVGFVFTERLTVNENVIEWSADNGISLSRGCTDVVANSNTIIGSYYTGIHCGGFAGDPGPQRLTITNNTIYNSRMYAISALDGVTSIVISNNVIDGVRRGGISTANRDYLSDAAPSIYGTGIHVRGQYVNGTGGSTTPTYTFIANDILIADNIVSNADRMGIIVGGGVDNATMSGNQITNVGSLFNGSGSVEISPTHKYYNIGIGIYQFHSASISNVYIVGNHVTDVRSTRLINHGVMREGGTNVIEASNLVIGTRNAQGTGISGRSWSVGDGTSGTSVSLNSSSSGLASVLFQSNGNSLFSMRKSTTNALEVFMYDSGISVPMKFNRSTGEIVLDLPTISDVVSNLYVDQGGILRKIV